MEDIIDLLQLNIFSKLTGSGYNVLDVPDVDTPFPFIKLGDTSLEVEKDKRGKVYGYNITHTLNVWDEQGNKQLSNFRVKHISDLLSEINFENYEIIESNNNVSYTDYAEARQAVITLTLKVDKKGR